MKNINKNHIIFILIALMVLLLQGAVMAEKETEVDSASVKEASSFGKDADDLLAKIDSLQQQAETHRSELKETDGESRSATFLQIVKQEEELRSALDDLVELINNRNENGSDTGALVSRVKLILADQATWIQQDIKVTGKLLRQFNETDQTEMPNEEIENLKQQIIHVNKYLDMSYAAAYENIERRGNLDLDFAADFNTHQT